MDESWRGDGGERGRDPAAPVLRPAGGGPQARRNGGASREEPGIPVAAVSLVLCGEEHDSCPIIRAPSAGSPGMAWSRPRAQRRQASLEELQPGISPRKSISSVPAFRLVYCP